LRRGCLPEVWTVCDRGLPPGLAEPAFGAAVAWENQVRSACAPAVEVEDAGIWPAIRRPSVMMKLSQFGGLLEFASEAPKLVLEEEGHVMGQSDFLFLAIGEAGDALPCTIGAPWYITRCRTPGAWHTAATGLPGSAMDC